MSGSQRLRWGEIARAAAITGSVASLASTVGVAIAAEVEGKAPLRPINASSHWLHGDVAARDPSANLAHTGVGYATNHAACLFWAALFETWQAWRPARTRRALVRDAALMAGIAAAVDYGATPKRFTPGWELVLTRAGMAGAYAALALGFAAGSSCAKRPRRG